VEELLALSRAVYGSAPDDILLVEIPAHALHFHEGLSSGTEAAMNTAVEVVEKYLSRIDL
jgi:hypothetical protein